LLIVESASAVSVARNDDAHLDEVEGAKASVLPAAAASVMAAVRDVFMVVLIACREIDFLDLDFIFNSSTVEAKKKARGKLVSLM
jgi:hypothetical protein